jgi:hypothetical protein
VKNEKLKVKSEKEKYCAIASFSVDDCDVDGDVGRG